MSANPPAPTYPSVICNPCGREWGKNGKSGVASWYPGICEVCGERAMVTEPRDFGHLKDGWESAIQISDDDLREKRRQLAVKHRLGEET